MLVPSAVRAVDTFSNVAIMDSVSGVKAKVDSSKRLAVGDGGGSMTADGTVTERPASPADFFFEYNGLSGGNTSYCRELVAPPAGKAAVLTGAYFDAYSNPSPSTSDLCLLLTGTSCDGSVVAWVTPPGLGQTTLPSDPGLVSTTGFSVIVAGQQSSHLTVNGYFVPAAGLPATRAAQSAPDLSGLG